MATGYGQKWYMAARFDNGPLQQYLLTEPANGRGNTALVEEYDRFVRNLRNAKTVKIEVSFFQETQRVFEFDVHGLEW
jgi:hypothetical protein